MKLDLGGRKSVYFCFSNFSNPAINQELSLSFSPPAKIAPLPRYCTVKARKKAVQLFSASHVHHYAFLSCSSSKSLLFTRNVDPPNMYLLVFLLNAPRNLLQDLPAPKANSKALARRYPRRPAGRQPQESSGAG